MEFKENFADVFISFLTNAEYRAWVISRGFILFGVWLVLVFALTYPTQVYSGGFQMLDKETKAQLLNLAMDIEKTGFDKNVMGFYFDNWTLNPQWKRDAYLTFWLSVPVGRRLFFEIMRMLQAPSKRAITYTV